MSGLAVEKWLLEVCRCLLVATQRGDLICLCLFFATQRKDVKLDGKKWISMISQLTEAQIQIPFYQIKRIISLKCCTKNISIWCSISRDFLKVAIKMSIWTFLISRITQCLKKILFAISHGSNASNVALKIF